MSLKNKLSYRIFPIYIRYLDGENMFALVYFNKKEYFEFGLACESKISSQFEDASWMKYREIKYSIKIFDKDNLDSLFRKIKSNV